MVDSTERLPPIELALTTVKPGESQLELERQNDRLPPRPSSSSRRLDLPRINDSSSPSHQSSRGRSIAVTKENTMIVGTGKSSSPCVDGQQGLPGHWTEQRVNPPEDDKDHRTKLQWENQIAKHILTLFATSHAVNNSSAGGALLDFVDVDKGPNSPQKTPVMSTTPQKVNGDTAVHSSSYAPILEEGVGNETGEYQGDEEDDEAVLGAAEHTAGSAVNAVKRMKKGKRKVKNTKKKASENKVPEPIESIEAIPLSEEEKKHIKTMKLAEEVIQRVRSEAQMEELLGEAAKNGKSNNLEELRITHPDRMATATGQKSSAASLPPKAPTQIKDKHRISNTITMRDGTQIVVRGSPRCFPIWFVSTGDVYANWTMLPGGHKLQAHLNALYETQNYSEYLDFIESTLTAMWRKELYGEEDFTVGSFGLNVSNKGKQGNKEHQDISFNKKPKKKKKKKLTAEQKIQQEYGQLVTIVEEDSQGGEDTSSRTSMSLIGGEIGGIDDAQKKAENEAELLTEEELLQCWQQMVLTAIAMGILYLERKMPDQAMLLFKRAEEWASNDLFIKEAALRKELKAHVRDAISYFFFKRRRSIAALGYSSQAQEMYEQVGNMDGVATCLLHCAAVHSQVGQFKEAHRVLFEFLAMVESGRLATADATPKQLCLVAIGYHNLAVVQLKLAMPDLACKNSQSARKIARLCLAFSNRWIETFQYTHEIAVADVKYDLMTKNASELTTEQLALTIELAEALFDPFSELQQAGADHSY